jgi:hypothetical protein
VWSIRLLLRQRDVRRDQPRLIGAREPLRVNLDEQEPGEGSLCVAPSDREATRLGAVFLQTFVCDLGS